MTGTLVAGLLAGYGVAVPVGAIAALLVGLTARTSFRVGAAAALGVATADGLYALAAVLGGTALAAVVEPVGPALRTGAAAVLVALAARMALVAWRGRHRPPPDDPSADGPEADDPPPGDPAVDGPAADDPPADGPEVTRRGATLTAPGRAYLGLLGLTLLNPATVVYFTALVLGRQAADGLSAAGGAVFVAGAFAASASWQLLLAGAGAVVGRLLTGPRGRLLTALAASAVIAVLAVSLLLPR